MSRTSASGSLRKSVEGALLEVMLLIDDAEPTTVRLHLRRRGG